MQYRAKIRRSSQSARRGLSSAIAAVFMFIIVSGALTVTVWSTKQQDNVTNQLLEKTRTTLANLNEEIDIAGVSIVNDRFNITLSNDGGMATRVKSLYIVNETATPKEQYRYDIDYLVDGSGAVTNVGQSLAFVASNTTTYSVKVMTESGNSASADFLPVSLTPLPMSLYVIPPTVTTGEEITVLYAITNNITDSSSPLNISPVIASSISCQVSQACSLTKLESAPSSIVVHKGATTLIKEVYQANGPPDTVLTFNASYTGAVQGNYVTEQGTIIVVDLAQSVVTSIATAPDIYLMLPGPFGTTVVPSNERGLWGAVVVNPTNSPMEVSRVLMTAFTAAHDGTTKIVSGPPNADCSMEAITPADANPNLDDGWSCPHDNQIMWADLDDPQILAANETRTFLVRVQPTSISGNEEPGVTVTATVYTDVGVFTQTGYTVGLTQAHQPLGNVYLTTNGDPLVNANMLGHMNNIAPNTNTTFYVAMSDLDANAATYINNTARLIINVPPGFGNVTITSHNKFDTPTVTVRADGITQIVGITNQDIGDLASGESAVIAFASITPSPAISTTYLMFAFIDGGTTSETANNGFSAGAIAETALQVNGS